MSGVCGTGSEGSEADCDRLAAETKTDIVMLLLTSQASANANLRGSSLPFLL
jgi:hypothetical protein